MSRPLWKESAAALSARVRAGTLGAVEAMDAGWDGPASLWEHDVHAVVHTDREARHAAAEAAPTHGPLAGVPVLVKDNLCTVD